MLRMLSTRLFCRRLASKVDYYYAQAAVQITYWNTIQAHAICPPSEAAGAALRHVAGLASASAALEHAMSEPPFVGTLVAFHAADDDAADEDFPPRVCFLPAGQTASPELTAMVTSRGGLLGVTVPMLCAGPEEDWPIAVE